jgi:hypothetical protein
MSAYISRFDQLSKDLNGEDMKVPEPLGYATDNVQILIDKRNNDTNQELDLESFRHFFASQYALSPHIIEYEQKSPFLIGNFSSENAGLDAVNERHWNVVKNYKQGVFLLSTVDSGGK